MFSNPSVDLLFGHRFYFQFLSFPLEMHGGLV
jgi:hypothetical protein